MIIDTHCHAGLYKYEPIESLLYHMEQNSVTHAVLIQYMGNTDNSYMVACLNDYPGRFAAAMIVDHDDDGSQIQRWAEQGINGVRLSVDYRGTGSDPLAHWRTANKLGLVISAPCNPQKLASPAFIEVVEQFPNLQIVIEHLAGIGRGSQPPYQEFAELMQLARYPNLTIKLPGFGELCDLTPIFSAALAESQEQLTDCLAQRLPEVFGMIPPLVDMTLEAFGPARMMWGSDYPPVSSREGYGMSLKLPQVWLQQLSPADQALIFGQTAARIWGLG